MPDNEATTPAQPVCLPRDMIDEAYLMARRENALFVMLPNDTPESATKRRPPLILVHPGYSGDMLRLLVNNTPLPLDIEQTDQNS